MLTTEEMELVASLAESRAFTLVLENLQAEIDTEADRMDSADTNEESLRRLAMWKAMRRILAILRGTPQLMSATLAEMREREAAEQQALFAIDTENYIRALKWADKAREAHLAHIAEQEEAEHEL